MKGKILVTIQFTCLALLMIVTDWLRLPWWGYLMLGISGFLAFWAMAVMKLGNFNIVPNPVVDGRLVSKGPYKVIRHPMYSSIFIFAFSLLVSQFDYKKLSITFFLIAGLVVKMMYEELLLKLEHPDYEGYIAKTKRVIPFIW